ncbi:Protease synthase and sporulation protein PAI 2 [Shewanella sp. P1-14-1]|uniref:FMN-binding negative transcriptional regulator n=1 Tax=Shewanella sp. P1-14-1 TaxID=1723761 RepID=UPI0006D65893|nr:FMN-binding negative transcriptional regulator [Shewanella sp. P1-14-1]KPZ71554.1 Protease synthase and sporulation protein PAI 2 [Shewanella sp. P1-14-1]
MYIPKNLRINDLTSLHKFVADYGFAVITTADLTASHLPLLLKLDEGELGTLYGHMARANQHWKIADGQSVLTVFSGPHGYISPTWYESSPAVPTWNYAAVHVKGTVTLTDDETTLSILNDTIAKYEPSLLSSETHGHDGFIPPDYKLKLAKAIVGFKVKIDSIEGKNKLGQHRSLADQKGVLAGLSESSRLDDQALLAYTKLHYQQHE